MWFTCATMARWLFVCLCCFLVLGVPVQCQNKNTSQLEQPTTSSSPPPVSVYEAFQNLFQALQQAGHALTSNYQQMVQNDTSVLANWIAYSKLLKPVNNALLDSLFPALTGNAELDISTDCVLTLVDFAQAIDQQQSWAYRILDSSGNIFPSGFMSGSFSHLGDFDQCIETSEMVSNQQIRGQYCLVKYNFHVPTNKTRLRSNDLVFNTSDTALQNTFFADILKYAHVFKVRSARIGICLPSVCTQKDIQTLVDHFLEYDKVHMVVDSCQTAEDYAQYSPMQLTIIGVLASLVVIVICATIFELSFCSKPKFSLRNESLVTLVTIFSAYSNTKALMSTKHSGDNLRSINGIRVLTMCWLVYAHAYFLSIKETFRSSSKFIESIYDLKMYFVLNAWPAVEIFFIISALLHSYHVFQYISSTRQINIIKLIINRVARLWPNLWLVVGLVFLVPSLAQGPLWPDVMKQQVDSCYNTWWKVPLFVSNFREPDETCQVHTWYLSVDTQLYLISFIFIILFYKYTKKAIFVSMSVALVVCFCISVYFYLKQHVPTILFNNVEERQIYEDMANVYMPTYYHFTPYLVGLITGYALMRAKKNQIRLNKTVNLILWVICVIITVLVILSGYIFTAYPETSLANQSVYAGYHRLLWSMAVCYLIFACENKQGGIISEIFGHQMFVPLGRLSYLVYLVHFIVTWARTAYLRVPLAYSNYTLLNEFIINLIWSLTLAFFFYLLVEAPFNKLYSTYIGKKEWPFGEIDLGPLTTDDDAKQKQVVVDTDRKVECKIMMP